MTRLVAGTGTFRPATLDLTADISLGAADRSESRRFERHHEQLKTAETLSKVTEVTREVVPSRMFSARFMATRLLRIAPRTLSRPTDPLPLRRPRRPIVQTEPDPTLLARYKQNLPRKDVFPQGPELPPKDSELSSKGSDAALPPLPEMEGIGRYRMAKNISEGGKISNLRRAMSDMSPQMVEQVANLGLAEPRLVREAASRPPSPKSSFRVSNSAPTPPPNPPRYLEYIDRRRGSLVQRGFSPSSSPSISGSATEGFGLRSRNGSAVSMTSMSSDGDSSFRRKVARQEPNPMLHSGSRPIRTMDQVTSPPEIAASARIRESDLMGSAIASDDEDGENREALLSSCPKKASAMPPRLSQERQQYIPRGRPRGRVRVAPRLGGHSPERRASRQVRFRESPGRLALPNINTQLPEVAEAQQAGILKTATSHEDADNPPATWVTTTSDSPALSRRPFERRGPASVVEDKATSEGAQLDDEDKADSSSENSEAGDAPSDLALFIVGEPGKQEYEKDDSHASASPNKTTVAWPRKVYNKLTLGGRRRSATVIHHPKVDSKEHDQKDTDTVD